MFLGELEQERVEFGALGVRQRGEEFVVERVREGADLDQGARADRAEPDGMSAAVARVASTLDQAFLLQLVEQSDELAAVVAERVGDRALRLARALVEDGENRVMVGAEVDLFIGADRALLGREPEPLQQERRRGDQLSQGGAAVRVRGTFRSSPGIA